MFREKVTRVVSFVYERLLLINSLAFTNEEEKHLCGWTLASYIETFKQEGYAFSNEIGFMWVINDGCDRWNKQNFRSQPN